MGYIKLDKEVENDISCIIKDFSFYNGLYKKFTNIFEILKLEIYNEKRHIKINIYQKAYWTLFVLAHKYVLDKRSDIVDSVSLLGALFYWMLNSKHLISKNLNFNSNLYIKNLLLDSKNDGKKLINEISRLLNLRDLGRFENVLNDFANYLQTLRLQEILLENWGTISKIEVS